MYQVAKISITCLAVAFVLLLAQGMDAKEKPERVLRHIVCFKFTDEAKEAQIAAVVKAFAALEKKIPSVKGFETGTNNSPEGLNKKFTHCFVVTFTDEKGRDEYLPHPEHKKFVKLLKPILDDVFVIDYWSR
jgi:hypothetical protein